jgi:hypothetical protein
LTNNFSLICQIRDFGSGQILQPRQLYLSPGFAKIAPWWLARRDNFSAKVPGLVSADGATNVYSLNRRAVSKNTVQIFLHSATRPASNKIHRDKRPFRLLSVCTAMLIWRFKNIVSGDKSCYRDNSLRQPHNPANALIKNWLPTSFC